MKYGNKYVKEGEFMIKKLIEEGKTLKECMHEADLSPAYMEGVEYEAWVAKGILFLEKNYPKSSLTAKFKSNAESNYASNYEKMLGILIGINEIEENESK